MSLSLLFFLLTYGAGFDFTLASFLFELEGNTWLLQHHWLTETLLHSYVRTLNEILLVSLLLYWLWRHLHLKERSQQHSALGILLLSLLLSYATVALIKRLVPMECPWDLLQFGGHSAFWGLFDQRPESLQNNQCFPAGHSSIGFAWLALFYYWRELKPKQARLGIYIGLGLGLTLGFVQQLRGAHFVSHDIATAAICWLVATSVYLRYQPGKKPVSTLAPIVTVTSSTPVFPFNSAESSDV